MGKFNIEDYENYKPKKESVKKTTQKLASGGNNDFIKLGVGEKKLRFLPYPDGESWVEGKIHGHKSAGKFHTLNCEEFNCFVCIIKRFLEDVNDNESRNLAKDIRPQTRYFFSAYDRDEEKVGVVNAPKELSLKIIDAFNKYDSLFSIKTGRDFYVKGEKPPGGFLNYSQSFYDLESSPLFKTGIKKDMDEDEIKRRKKIYLKKVEDVLTNLPDLQKMVRNNSPDRRKTFIESLLETIDEVAFRKWCRRNGIDFDEIIGVDEDEKQGKSKHKVIDVDKKKSKKKLKDEEDEDEEDEEDENEEEEEKSSKKKPKKRPKDEDDDEDEDEEEEEEEEKSSKKKLKKRPKDDDEDEFDEFVIDDDEEDED